MEVKKNTRKEEIEKVVKKPVAYLQ